MIIKVNHDSDYVEISSDNPTIIQIKVKYPSQILEVLNEVLNIASVTNVELIKVDEGIEHTIGEW